MRQLAYDTLTQEISTHREQRSEFDEKVGRLAGDLGGIEYELEGTETAVNCDECDAELFTHYYRSMKQPTAEKDPA